MRGQHQSGAPDDPNRLRLWPMRKALTASSTAVVLGLIGLTFLAWALLHQPKLPHSSSISLHDLIGVLQLVFASVAGAGALVALVMAYRRQKVAETATAHDRTRVLNERFNAIAAQLGDNHAAVRLAGVHAMAGLADDWEESRQTCIDVLCAYLRLPYEDEPIVEASAAELLMFRGNREVRHTVIRIITAHLRETATVSWQRMNFDFTGATFDGGDFSGAIFSGGNVSFLDALFIGPDIIFDDTRFCGADVSFERAEFSQGNVTFFSAEFSDGFVVFDDAIFSGGDVSFAYAVFSGGDIGFDDADFSAGKVDFGHEDGLSSTFNYSGAKFCGSDVGFIGAKFSGAKVEFIGASFSSGALYFRRAEISAGKVIFDGAKLLGTEVKFSSVRFSGGTVDFSNVADWSHPPKFDWQNQPPSTVKLPTEPNNHKPDANGANSPASPRP